MTSYDPNQPLYQYLDAENGIVLREIIGVGFLIENHQTGEVLNAKGEWSFYPAGIHAVPVIFPNPSEAAKTYRKSSES